MRKKKRNQFLLLVKDLKEGENNLFWVIKSEELPIPDMAITSDIKVKMVIKKSGDKLLTSGVIDWTALVTCAYCGREFTKEFSEEFSGCYVKGDERKLPADLALNEDEIDRNYYLGDFVNLESLIRDTIILSLPIAPQCDQH